MESVENSLSDRQFTFLTVRFASSRILLSIKESANAMGIFCILGKNLLLSNFLKLRHSYKVKIFYSCFYPLNNSL